MSFFELGLVVELLAKKLEFFLFYESFMIFFYSLERMDNSVMSIDFKDYFSSKKLLI